MEQLTEEIRALNKQKNDLEKEIISKNKQIKHLDVVAKSAQTKADELSSVAIYEKGLLKEVCKKRKFLEKAQKEASSEYLKVLEDIDILNVAMVRKRKELAAEKEHNRIEIKKNKNLIVKLHGERESLQKAIADHKIEQEKACYASKAQAKELESLKKLQKAVNDSKSALEAKEKNLDAIIEERVIEEKAKLTKQSRLLKAQYTEITKQSKTLEIEQKKAEKAKHDAEHATMKAESAKLSFNSRLNNLDLREKQIDIDRLKLTKMAREQNLTKEYEQLQKDVSS